MCKCFLLWYRKRMVFVNSGIFQVKLRQANTIKVGMKGYDKVNKPPIHCGNNAFRGCVKRCPNVFAQWT